MGQHYIYKYVYEDEIIYIGKTDNRPLSCRIKEHAKEPKFKPFLEGCKIYYFETIHQTENGLFESCLIDRYKPRLNVIDNHPEGVGRFNNIEEPEWTEYSFETYKAPKKIKNTKKEPVNETKYPQYKAQNGFNLPTALTEDFLHDTAGLGLEALRITSLIIGNGEDPTSWFQLNREFYSILSVRYSKSKDKAVMAKKVCKKTLPELEEHNIIDVLSYEGDPVIRLNKRMKKYVTTGFSLDYLDLNDPIAKFVFDTLSPAFEDPECQDFIRKLF